METKIENPERAEVVRQLEEDRQRIAQRAALPAWFYPALSIIAALYVITPALPYSQEQNSGFIFALFATLFLIWKVQRITGIKVHTTGRGSQLIAFSMILVILIGLSFSYGLVSFGLHWWTIAPAAAVFGGVLMLSKSYGKLINDQLSHEL